MHNLEHGYTLLWYDDTAAKNKDQVAIIKAISKKFEGTKLSDKFIALPWTSKDEDGKSFPKGTHIALTHWSAGGDPSDVKKQQGVWQYCGKASGTGRQDLHEEVPLHGLPRAAGRLGTPGGAGMSGPGGRRPGAAGPRVRSARSCRWSTSR